MKLRFGEQHWLDSDGNGAREEGAASPPVLRWARRVLAPPVETAPNVHTKRRVPKKASEAFIGSMGRDGAGHWLGMGPWGRANLKSNHYG